jgi:hypothetical protein
MLVCAAYGRCDPPLHYQTFDGTENNDYDNVSGESGGAIFAPRARLVFCGLHVPRFLQLAARVVSPGCRGQGLGSVGTPLLRVSKAAFEGDGVSPPGYTRPNPRVISNVVNALPDPQPGNDRDMSSMVYVWGQVRVSCPLRLPSPASTTVAPCPPCD